MNALANNRHCAGKTELERLKIQFDGLRLIILAQVFEKSAQVVKITAQVHTI